MMDITVVKVPFYLVVAVHDGAIHVLTDDGAFSFVGAKSIGVAQLGAAAKCISCKVGPCDHGYFIEEARQYLEHVGVANAEA